jgi:hypothetical protein
MQKGDQLQVPAAFYTGRINLPIALERRETLLTQGFETQAHLLVA